MLRRKDRKLQQMQQQQEGNPFVKRVMEIPIVKSTSDWVVSDYNKVKQLNGLVGGVLEKAEDVVQFGNHTFVQPMAKVVHRPVNAISKSADRQLEYLEKLYPPISYTPQQMKKAYNELTLKDTLLFLLNLPSLIIFVIAGWTREIIIITGDAIKAIFAMCIDTLYAIFPKKPLDWIFDHIVNPAIYIVGLVLMLMITTPYYIFVSIVQDVCQVFDWIKGKVSGGALFTVKLSTNITAGVSDRVISTVSPYTPEMMQKPTTALLSYIRHWREVIQQATSLEDILKAIIEETKQNLRLAQQTIQNILSSNKNGNNHQDTNGVGKRRRSWWLRNGRMQSAEKMDDK